MKKLLIMTTLCLLCLIVSADGHTLPEGFDVQGHRGARGLKPENTLPAFEVALDLGVTTLELDMHYTADNHVVVWHDDAIKREFCRLPEGVELDLPENTSLIFGSNPLMIRKLTLEQIQSFHCDTVQSGAYRMQDNDATLLAGDDYRMPTLTDVFEFVERYAASELKTPEQRENAARVRFNIESKRQANDASAIDDDFDGENIGEFESLIMEQVIEHDLMDRVVLQSFDHRVLWAVKDAYPDATIAALTSRNRPQFEVYVERGATIWSPNFNAIDADLVAAAQAMGLKVIPWTVNEADDMRVLIEWGVDGIITDRPDILLNLSDAE